MKTKKVLDVSPVPLNGVKIRVVLGKEDAQVSSLLEHLFDFVELLLESVQLGQDLHHAAALPLSTRSSRCLSCRRILGGWILLLTLRLL